MPLHGSLRHPTAGLRGEGVIHTTYETCECVHGIRIVDLDKSSKTWATEWNRKKIPHDTEGKECCPETKEKRQSQAGPET